MAQKVIRLTETDLTNLVQRVIKENTMAAQADMVNQEMVDLGLDPLTPEEIGSLGSCVGDDSGEVPQEHLSTYQKIMQAADNASAQEIKAAIKQIKALKRRGLNEQSSGNNMAFGVELTTIALKVLGGLLLIGLIERFIMKLLGKGRDKDGCGPGSTRVRSKIKARFQPMF
jgi:hypothetical protein